MKHKTKEEQLKRLKEYSYWLLGQKNYSVAEIKDKFENYISKKQFSVNESDYLSIIDHLLERDYLNDQRTAESLIRSVSLSFRGPMKIRQKFIERKLDVDYLDNFEDDEIDWFELCKNYYERKYSEAPKDYNEKSKRYRHLAGRGYYPDHINYAIDEADH